MIGKYTEKQFKERLIRICNIPKRYIDLDIESMDDYGLIKYRDVLDNFISLEKTMINYVDFELFLILLGNFGAGKTRIVISLLKTYYKSVVLNKIPVLNKEMPYFIKSFDLGKYRFSKFESDDDFEVIRDRIFNSKFLIIDDIARISGYKGEHDFLEQVVEKRYDNCLSTILTSSTFEDNFNGDRFKDYLSNFDVINITSKTRKERKDVNG